VGELLKRIGAAELAEWEAELYVLRPEDEEAAMEEARAEAERENG
jgi:hypothetical protein